MSIKFNSANLITVITHQLPRWIRICNPYPILRRITNSLSIRCGLQIRNEHGEQLLITYLTLLMLLSLGLWLRYCFIQTAQLYPDEFVTLLAVQMIGEKGLPVMPSGLFYDHGLLFSYLGYLSTFFGEPRLMVRYASLLCGMATLAMTFFIGQRYFSAEVGLIATAGLVIAPTAIEWSGRARMYALLQLLVLLTLGLAYEGLANNRARWLALLTYLAAGLTHFVAVILSPPLLLVGLMFHRTAQNQKSKLMLQILAWGVILIIIFLVKRVGQPKGIATFDSTNVASGLLQVLAIYGNLSLNLMAGWQTIAPFYLTLPAIIFTPFALLSIIPIRSFFRSSFPTPLPYFSMILLMTTLEMIFLVSPDRRDDKYLFMLLPILFLLGAQGMENTLRFILQLFKILCGHGVQSEALLYSKVPPRYTLDSQTTQFIKEPILHQYTDTPQRLFNMRSLSSLLLCALILIASRPTVQTLLTNTGDDYDTAFAYIKAHWQNGDTILTGTPAAAFFYLGRNDFYTVQRHGGYDYRLLTVNGQAVDRWLASPAIRTTADLQQTLARQRVWLVLERWGLQQEYYELPFQQQLLAQTDYVTESQGIFILHSKANPQPIALEPTHSTEAIWGTLSLSGGGQGGGGNVRLIGYTLESSQPNGLFQQDTPFVAGQTLRLTLYWQAITALPDNYTIFVHFRHLHNRTTVAQADHRPLDHLYPTSLWPLGETIRESSVLALPTDLSPGDYELWIGLYLFETGERLPLQHDSSGENAFKLEKVTITKK